MYFFALVLTLLSFFPVFYVIKRRRFSKRLPPGSLGLPLLGQSLEFLGAMRSNIAENWLDERVKKYGPVSKLRLLGTPTVFIHGQAANKFIFSSDSRTLSNQQPQSIRRLMGERNLLEVDDKDHKRVRNALGSFLKPEALKQYVGNMDAEIREHLRINWEGKQKVTVFPLMKTLTFNIMSSLLFGLEPGTRRDKFEKWIDEMTKGLWTIPVNIPYTRFNRSIKASLSIKTLLMRILHERRLALKNQQASPQNDLITSILSMHGEDGAASLSDEEIVDNARTLMFAGHDTTAMLLTFLLRHLANDQTVYAAIVREQEEVARGKISGELLTWEDLTKMKYTWRTSLEILRLIPPAFGGFRKTTKDIEFGGYHIPKGWQVFWAAHMTHMDESIFPEPWKFDPERFDNKDSVPPYCYVSFGAGRRICPGYEFARIETLVAVHYLITRFTWKLCGKDNNFCRDPLPNPTEGLPIQIEPRKMSSN